MKTSKTSQNPTFTFSAKTIGKLFTSKLFTFLGLTVMVLEISGCDVDVTQSSAVTGSSEASSQVMTPPIKQAPNPSPAQTPASPSHVKGHILVDTAPLGKNQYLVIRETGDILISPTHFDLPDAVYTLVTRFGNGTFGTFRVENGFVKRSTGAIIQTKDGVSFDLSKLTSVTVDPSVLSAPNPGLLYVRVLELDAITNARMQLHIPNGTYSISACNNGSASFGSFQAVDGVITRTDGALLHTDNGLTFNAGSLAQIQIDPTSLGTNPLISPVVAIPDLETAFNTAITFLLPDGTFRITTRSGNGLFGSFDILHGQISSSAGAVLYRGKRIAFALNQLTAVTIDPTALNNLIGNSNFESLPDLWTQLNSAVTYFLPQGTYPIKNYTGVVSYGTFTVGAGGQLETTGSLKAGANEVSFDFHLFASVTLHLSQAELEDITTSFSDAGTSRALESTYILPDGIYYLNSHSTGKSLGSFEVKGGVIVNLVGKMNIVAGALYLTDAI